MAPRSNEPRRDTEVPRRGSSRSTAGRDSQGRGGAGDGDTPERRLGGISDARSYTPRGRTVRDAGRPDRSGDPFRPALQVLDGGRKGPVRRTPAQPARGSDRAGGRGEPDRADRGARDRGTGRAGRDGTGRAGTDRTGTGRAATERGRSTGSRAARGPGAAPAPRRGSGTAGRGQPVRPHRKPRPPQLANPNRRLRLGSFLALTLFVVIGIRLVVIQVVDTPAYADGGLAGRLSSPVVIPAPRGTIYDRGGAVLAHSVEARYVYADPTKVTDPAAAATALSPLLGIPKSQLLPRLLPQKRPDGNESQFEYLARGVDIETAEQILELDIDGVRTHRDERREVPGGDLGANLIGFTGDDMSGLEGIEARYDDVLRGVNGERIFEVGRGDLDKAIPDGYLKETEAQPGSSLVLTIDRDLQFEVQRILSEAMARVRATTGTAVVMDIRTGEVLAQASHPTYDAANWKGSKPTDREDAATSFVVDPGSVHKPIVFGAALEEGVIAADGTLPVPATINKGGTTYRDSRNAQGAHMSLPGMMAYSSNVGTIMLADQLGAQRLYDYQLKFGLGKATGEGMPGEAAGRVLEPKDWNGSSPGSIPIGHSVDVTPLQMTAVYAAIANGGTWVQPRLIHETIGPDGTRTAAPAPETRRVISPENAAALRTVMEAVTTVPGATGLKAAIPGYRVAGKTGTGSRVVDGRYAPGEVASFIGMAPADNPRYVVSVFAHTPGGGGGDIAAPTFKDIMTFTLLHYRVPPTGTEPPKFVVFPG
ncbi:penicillin-binding transpeptidase domain-containing protein [Polymorphospora sp. NPDC050346]|uniref:penicillin-binding transpeptidase domain-containing protein n=1 Tax=Polymorphospora sp. NPDC050346 TaxID=3155780 RepID=UPI0033E4134A